MQQQSGAGTRCRRDAGMSRDILIAAAWLLCAASAVGSLYLLCAGFATRRFTARAQRPAAVLPPVSILKPLCGEDAGLYDNLESFCRQEYPTWQVVFGVQDAHDAAVPVVRRLMAAYPGADMTLVAEPARRGGNLKVANLQNMLPAARHDVIVIADSDMRVRPDYLAEVTAPLAEGATGLVTCLYRGVSAGGFWSQLACLNINHGFLPQALVAAALGERSGCFGATLALRRDTLEAVGGLAVVADSLADDHALGAAVRRLGRKVVLSPHVVDNVVAAPRRALPARAALVAHDSRHRAGGVRRLGPDTARGAGAGGADAGRDSAAGRGDAGGRARLPRRHGAHGRPCLAAAGHPALADAGPGFIVLCGICR